MLWKRRIESDEYHKLSLRLSELEARLTTYNARLEAQEMANTEMRNKVLRKIQAGKDNPYEQKEEHNGNMPFSPFS